ncbi:hypothetical protein ACFQQB_39460 [Nonomuraea rubra]|uniref:hypothetical protein n=1 Tax=Nonomuraea rubra TaxID=46180 RepID=UPI00360EF667
MTEDDIIEFVRGLPGTVVFTAGPGDGSPEVAWGTRSSSTILTAWTPSRPTAACRTRRS